MNQLTSQDIPTINPHPSLRYKYRPSPTGKPYDIKFSKHHITFEENALRIINNESKPDEKWCRYIDSRVFVSSLKRLIVKGELSTATTVTVDRKSYTHQQIYLTCHRGYNPDVHLIDWLKWDVVPRYMSPDEDWAPVTIHGKTVYMSSLGRAHSKHDRILTYSKHRGGYLALLIDRNKAVYVHRLVWMAFNPDVDISNYVVNHLNHCRDDNRLENLESVTQQENMAYSNECGYKALQLGRIREVFVPDRKRVDVTGWVI
jgi:hypothetical protein